jgi:hypothetical protein
VREWKDPRDGKAWRIETIMADSSTSVWKVTRTSEEHSVVVRFCPLENTEAAREAYFSAPTSPCDPTSIPEERLMALLDRAKSRA